MSDTFISYAHIDNQVISGAETDDEKGWITHFVNNLRNEVGRQVGRKENYQEWMDFLLHGNDGITPEIEKQLNNANTLLIFLSKGWLASEWCQRELEIFLQANPNPESRIFVIELTELETNNKPEAFRDLLTYRFWKKTDKAKIRQFGYPIPQAKHTDYYDLLFDLSNELAETIQCLATQEPAETSAKIVYKETVYVAPVNDSLYKERSRLISELHQFGIDCLPRNNKQDNEMEKALEQCSHFIQLLDDHYTMGIPANQFQIANKLKKPILQWRYSKLDISKAKHEQRELLEGNYVIASNISDFSRHVINKVLPPPPEEVPDAINGNEHGMIFIHAGQQDFDWAKNIADSLVTKGYGIALPRYTGDSKSIRKSIERGLNACNTLLMLQHKTPADVVEDFLSEAHLYATEKKDNFSLLVCQGRDAESLCFRPPGTRLLSCQADVFGENCIKQFLLEVEA